MKYKNLLASARSRLGFDPPVVVNSVLGTPLKVREGTFPEQPDYDDGWLFALITQSKVFFDVGSNVGQMSLMACLDNPHRTIVVMDANARALATAAENLLLNGFTKQVRFVHAFISDTEDEEIEFFAVAGGQAGSKFRSHSTTASAINSSFKVRTTMLDHVAVELNLVPDLIKVDVEGAEAEVLAGTRDLALNHSPRFLVEMHSRPELPMPENGERVLAWCREVNYDAYYLKTHERVSSPSAFASRGRCHLFLQRQGEPYPSVLNGLRQGATVEEAQQAVSKSRLSSASSARTDQLTLKNGVSAAASGY